MPTTSYKPSTKVAQIFLCELLKKRRGVVSREHDWRLTKKYKDREGNVCRDFYSERLKIKAIVITSRPGKSIICPMAVIEDADYTLFRKETAPKLTQPQEDTNSWEDANTVFML